MILLSKLNKYLLKIFINKMENLPADVQRHLALELEPYSLISLCSSSKSFYKDICSNDSFWRLKIEKDFYPVFKNIQNMNHHLINPKKTYMRLFTKLSEVIEQELQKELQKEVDSSPERSRLLYKVMYDSFLEINKIFGADRISKYFELMGDEELDITIVKTLDYYLKKYKTPNSDSLPSIFKIILKRSPLYKYGKWN
tara:strand:- start:117 stop:710 length:594 start_codon:yes stop_codon:yes gene_type:complete